MDQPTEKGKRSLTYRAVQRPEPKSYGAILRRWLWLILLLTAATTTVIYYRSSTAPPTYQASIELQVIAQEPEEVSLFTPLRGAGAEEQIRTVREDFINILNNPTIARRTIAELNLSLAPRQLLQAINVQAEGEFITVMARAPSPQAAEALATTHVNKALEYYRQVRSRPAEVIGQFIADQLQESEEELAEAGKVFLEFKLRHEIGSLQREIEALQDVIRSLRRRRDEARVEMERYLALAAEMEQAAQEAQQRAQEAEAQAAAAEEALRQLEKAEAEQAEEATGEVPTPEGQETLEELRRDKEAEMQKALAAADHYRSAARSFETDAIGYKATAEGYRIAQMQYEQIIARRKADLSALIGLSGEYDALQSRLDQAQERVNFLAGKANEAEIKKSQALSAGYLQIIEPAHTPTSPLPSNTWQLVALGGVVSLIMGTILAFLLEILTGWRRKAAPPAK